MTMRPPETGRACDLPAVGAFAFYLALSIAFFGRALLGHLSDFYFGIGVDPGLMMWSLVWWPHAIANGLNPLLTKAVWAPSGFNFAWGTSIPLASMLASPLTSDARTRCDIQHPLSDKPADKWIAAFLLCRYITRDYAASLLGGYIFGFSAFHAWPTDMRAFAHDVGVFDPTVCLSRVAPDPRRNQRAQFHTITKPASGRAISPVAGSFRDNDDVGRVRSIVSLVIQCRDRASKKYSALLASIACAYGVAHNRSQPLSVLLLCLRSLHIMARYTPPAFSVYPLNFLIPTPVNELGRIAFFRSISSGFVSGWTAEAGAYIGLPLMLVAVAYVRRHWGEPIGRILTYCLAAAIVLSLGPILRIYLPGYSFRIALPWWLLAKMPLLENAIAMRFSMYTFLGTGAHLCVLLCLTILKSAGKLALAAAVVLFNLPNTSAAYWVRPVDTPAFFRQHVYRHYLSKNQIVLILPYSYTGNSMMWQAQTHMYFAMAEGILPYPEPSAFLRWPIFASLTQRAFVPDAAEQFRGFIAAHDVETIIVTDKVLSTWRTLLSTIDSQPIKVDDVWLYRVRRQALPDVETTWLRLRTSFDTKRLVTLVTGADKYLSEGENLDSLSVLSAEKLNLIPQDLLVGPPILEIPGLPIESNPKTDPHFMDGLWLGKTPDGLVSVGAEVWYSAVAPMVEQLHGVASGIYYPYPDKLAAGVPRTEEPDGWLMMTFNREQLARASELLTTSTKNAGPMLFEHLKD